MSTVPKFGSFKPKAAIQGVKENVQERSKVRHHRRSDSPPRKGRPRSQDKSPRREHEAHRLKRSTDRKPEVSQPRSLSVEIAKDEFEESELFIVDRRGDKKNVEYGGLHRYDVPAHYRHGSGRILGAPQGATIDRDASTEKQVVLSSIHKEQHEHLKRPLASQPKSATSQRLRLIRPKSPENVNAEDDCIELASSLKRKRGSESPEIIQDHFDYRSIEGKAKVEVKPDDHDVEFASDSEEHDHDDDTNREARETNVQLNKAVKAAPNSADAWLALLEHQHKVVLPGQDVSTLTIAQRRTLADIRLAIYDKALKAIPKDASDRDKLVLGRLQEGSKLWESTKLTANWTEALEQNTISTQIWIKYLDSVQTDGFNFRFEKCKAAYLECLKMLTHRHSDDDIDKRSEVVSAQIYVFLRFTSFVRDSGYEEVAHALWQILLEYHFFRPPHLSTKDAKLASLEHFWEADVPRIGEEGAQGWKNFDSNTSQPSRSSQKSDQIDDDGAATSGFNLPAAVNDDEYVDDPFRFVMFADLRNIIELLLNDLPKLELVQAFLCFMDLPPLRSDGLGLGRPSYWSDTFLCHFSNSRSSTEAASIAELGQSARLKNEITTPFSLFHEAFGSNRHALERNDINPPAAIAFVHRILEQLSAAWHSSVDLLEYTLAFKLSYFPDRAGKAAKRSLKSHPTSLRLYNCYALIEVAMGNKKKAEEVWSIALDMSKDWRERERKDIVLLMHSRMMSLLSHGKELKALRYLIHPCQRISGDVDDEDVSATVAERLKAERLYEEGFQTMSGMKEIQHAALYADCHAWLTYLLGNFDLLAAVATFQRYISRLSGTAISSGVELLHQARAKLVESHIDQRRPYRPHAVRELLQESSLLFPENSMFHEIQAQLSARNRLDDRLRDVFSTLSDESKAIRLISSCYTIIKEIDRCNADSPSATANSVRATFSSLLLHTGSVVKYSPFLWTLWFDFELAVDQQRLRQVFYDGLRYLPWYKPWIEMGMRHLFGAENGGMLREKQQLYDVMAEREMRVRVGDE